MRIKYHFTNELDISIIATSVPVLPSVKILRLYISAYGLLPLEYLLPNAYFTGL